jgi:hypothetical protein
MQLGSEASILVVLLLGREQEVPDYIMVHG